MNTVVVVLTPRPPPLVNAADGQGQRRSTEDLAAAWREKEAERRAQWKAAHDETPWAKWKRVQNDPDPFCRDVIARLERAEREEPYHQVGENWRRAPWDVNPYEPIRPGFVVARDLPAPEGGTFVEQWQRMRNQ